MIFNITNGNDRAKLTLLMGEHHYNMMQDYSLVLREEVAIVCSFLVSKTGHVTIEQTYCFPCFFCCLLFYVNCFFNTLGKT